MTNEHDGFPALSDLLRSALADQLNPTAETFLDLLHQEIVFEFPYSPPGGVRRLDGKDAVRDYLPRVGQMIAIESMSLGRVVVQGSSAVVEFSCKGHSLKSNARYDQDYVSVIDLKDGLIVRYRDYWNPLIVLAASGGDQALGSILRGGE